MFEFSRHILRRALQLLQENLMRNVLRQVLFSIHSLVKRIVPDLRVTGECLRKISWLRLDGLSPAGVQGLLLVGLDVVK